MRNKKRPSDASKIHCNVEWHCFVAGTLSAATAATAIYHVAKRLSRDSGTFRVPVPDMAAYLGMSDNACRSAYQFLAAEGFFVLIREVPGSATEYRVVDHKSWAEAHPGQCCVKLIVSDNDDALRAALHGITGKNFWDNYMDAIRRCGFTDEYVIACTREVWAEHSKNPKGSFHNKLAMHLRERVVQPA